MRWILVAMLVGCGNYDASPTPLDVGAYCAPIDPCPGATMIDGYSACTTVSGVYCTGVAFYVRCHCGTGIVEAPFPVNAVDCGGLLSQWETCAP